MNTPTILLTLATATALLGAWLLRRGWRGRREGDHPHCRRCEFDLFGRATDSDACPECGADIHEQHAIAIGERHRRPGLATAGALILLCGVAGSVFVGSHLSKGIAWERYKTVAWLIRDGRSTDSDSRNIALAELLRRQQAGSLSTRQVAAVVDAALTLQGDRSAAWDFRWGDFVEAARKANGVNDAQWRTYAAQAVTTDYFWLSVTPRVSTREVPMAQLAYRKARVGRKPDLYANSRALAVFVDGQEYLGPLDDRDGNDAAEISVNGSGSRGGTRQDLWSALRRMPAGTHSGYIVYEVRVTPPPESRRMLRQRTASVDSRPSARQRMKQMYAEWHAVWSDVGRESAVAVARIQVPFEIELYEGLGGLRGSNAAGGPARAAEPLSAAMAKLTDARVACEAEARKRLLSVDPGDIASAAQMLEQQDSGVIKLLPEKKYPQELLGMHGAGAYFDFARQSHHYRTGREMSLQDGKFICRYGFFLEIGDVSPKRIAELTESPPPWVDETIKQRWSNLWGANEQLPGDLVASLGKSEARGGPRGVPAQAQRAYLFRSIDDVISSNILVGFRVLRICDDGSVVIAYRILKEFESPRRR